jgi:acyl-CoA hydrolase
MRVRYPRDSMVETTHLVLPPDTNTHHTAFGGKIMQWMDIAAGISAGRFTRQPVVTAAVDELAFNRPIRMADVVTIRACVNYTGRTSMEVGVKVEREDPHTGQLDHCLTGYFTFVAIDEQGQPVEVPQIEPQSEDEKRRYKNAQIRRRRRLETRTQKAT